jgi:hypothetical protein
MEFWRRTASSATLQRPFYPAYLQQTNNHLLAYFYSAPVAWFCSALDTIENVGIVVSSTPNNHSEYW